MNKIVECRYEVVFFLFFFLNNNNFFSWTDFYLRLPPLWPPHIPAELPRAQLRIGGSLSASLCPRRWLAAVSETEIKCFPGLPEGVWPRLHLNAHAFEFPHDLSFLSIIKKNLPKTWHHSEILKVLTTYMWRTKYIFIPYYKLGWHPFDRMNQKLF